MNDLLKGFGRAGEEEENLVLGFDVLPDAPTKVSIPENTLAFKNNNPGNLRFANQTGAVKGFSGFARFETPDKGFDALGRQVELDATRGHTLGSFINKYAPPIENDTESYLQELESSLGANRADKLMSLDFGKLSNALAKRESGTTITRRSNVERAVESITTGQGLLDGFSKTSDPTTPQSKLNPLSEGSPKKGSGAYDYLYGSLVEVPRDLVWGAVTWPVAQLVRHSAVAGQKIQQQLGLVPKMTPEQQAALGENAANYIQTLGGLATPKTETGKASLGIAGKVIEPINKFAHFMAQGVNPETHPNLHNVLATGVEFGVFATIPKIAKGLKKVAENRMAMIKMKGKAKQNAAIKIAKEQTELLKSVEESISKGEMDALIKERREKNQQLIAGAEGFSAIDIGKKSVEPVVLTKSELSQRGKGVSDTAVRPPNKVISLKEKLGPGIHLVESIPGEKSVWQIISDPLKNEAGSIQLPFTTKEFKQKLTPEIRESIRKIGKAAENAGVELKDFLKTQGMDSKQIHEMYKLHKLAKEERPFKAALTKDQTPFKSDPLRLQKNDVNINVNPSKRLNPKIEVGQKVVSQLESAVRTSTASLVKTFQPTLSGMKKFKIPLTKDLWHKANKIERARLEDLKNVEKKVVNLRDTYPKRKLREEAFIKVMSQDKLGRDAIQKLGVKPIDGPIKYEGLVLELEPLFKDLLDRVNETRESIGKPKVSRRKSFMPMIAQENFYDQIRTFFKGDKDQQGQPNLVLDNVDAINQRHDFNTAEATNFRHLKRGKLRGKKLEFDPLALYGKYSDTALKHIHYSPLNAFVEQLVNSKFKDSKGKNFELQKRNPELATFLSRWSNKLAGRPNVMLPEGLRFLEKGAQKISSNLTAATLGWSARTVLVQPTAMLPVAVEFGVMPTMKGLLDTVIQSKKAPIEKSNALNIRTADVFVNDIVKNQLGNKVQRVVRLPQEKALSAMKFVDSVVAEGAWRTAFKEANRTMSEREAIKFADEAMVRTQGSGFAGDLSPIQMNAIGKAVTLWQTFTINHVNWIAKEILGIKKPEQNPIESTRRVMTYVVGSALISTLFEDVMGIQSPQPAPIKAIQRGLEEGDTKAAAALKGLLELTEVLPIGSSVKFGSDPAGAVFQFLGDVSEGIAKDLPMALNGNKRAMQKLAFLLAKGVGVAGSGQIRRTVKGKQRGETDLGALLGRYTPRKKKSQKKRRKRRRSR